MAYVLEVTGKDGLIKYINSANATVYCPEYAAQYDDKKSALTVAAALLRSDTYRTIEVKKLTLNLCLISYKRNRSLSFNFIYPDTYKFNDEDENEYEDEDGNMNGNENEIKEKIENQNPEYTDKE